MKIFLPALLMGFLLLGSSLPGKAAPPSNLQVGFYLLHDVCHEESQVHLITMVKTTPGDLTDYVNHISRTADQTLAVIERLEKDDPSLRLDNNPLPPFEQEVRGSIRADKQHQLLFGVSGPSFTRALLLTQIEATNYILHIAKVLAGEDTDADRAHTLRKISGRWLTLRDRGVVLLNQN